METASSTVHSEQSPPFAIPTVITVESLLHFIEALNAKLGFNVGDLSVPNDSEAVGERRFRNSLSRVRRSEDVLEEKRSERESSCGQQDDICLSEIFGVDVANDNAAAPVYDVGAGNETRSSTTSDDAAPADSATATLGSACSTSSPSPSPSPSPSSSEVVAAVDDKANTKDVVDVQEENDTMYLSTLVETFAEDNDNNQSKRSSGRAKEKSAGDDLWLSSSSQWLAVMSALSSSDPAAASLPSSASSKLVETLLQMVCERDDRQVNVLLRQCALEVLLYFAKAYEVQQRCADGNDLCHQSEIARQMCSSAFDLAAFLSINVVEGDSVTSQLATKLMWRRAFLSLLPLCGLCSAVGV